MTEFLNWLVVGLLALASFGLLIVRSWRWLLGCLAALYLGAFIMVLAHWPLTMAATKLVTGWMAAAALGMTQLNLEARGWVLPWPDQGRTFRLAAAGMVAVSMFQVALAVNNWLPSLGFPVMVGAFLLIGQGLLQLGMTSEPMRVSIGLLTTLAGFEILYAAVENSILVAGMLAVVTLGLALTGSYLLNLQTEREAVE